MFILNFCVTGDHGPTKLSSTLGELRVVVNIAIRAVIPVRQYGVGVQPQ